MRAEAQRWGSCDRRILKAFYTQYVAVLLIILVFTIGAFQRTSQRDGVSLKLPAALKSVAPIGGVEIAQSFDELGQLGPRTEELEAVAMVLREHDVKASISLTVSMEKIHFSQTTLEQSLARLATLEKFFEERGVEHDSVEFVLGGPEAREDTLVVRFEGEDHDNFPF